MKLITIIAVLFIVNSLNAQNTQFWNNYSFINPATSGLENKHFGAITYQEQFGEYAPVNAFANYNTRIKDAHGIGINYSFNQISFFRTQTVSLNYNYQIKLRNSQSHKLSFGASLGVINNTILDYNCISCLPSSDPQTKRGVVPDINLGVAYLNKNLLLGVSVTQLTEPELNNYFQLRRRYSLLGSYNFMLGEKIKIKPQLLASTDFNYHSMDVNILVFFKSLWTGVSYSSGDTVSWMLGVDIKKTVRIGYSFSQTFNKLGNINRGRHEFVVGFKLK